MNLKLEISQADLSGLKSLSDVEIAQLSGQGDAEARRELLVRLLPRVRKTAMWLTRDEDEREDIVQMALVQIVRSAGGFRGESKLSYWADRVTVHTAARIFEKRDRRNRLASNVWHPGHDIPSVEAEAELSIMKGHLQSHLLQLPEKQRVPVVLHYLYGYKVDEIAEITSSKVNTVRGRLRNGLKTIRKNILDDPRMREWIQRRGT